MSNLGEFALPIRPGEFARRARRLQSNARALDRSARFAVSDATAARVTSIGVNVAAYLAGRVVRGSVDTPPGAIGAGVLELWGPFPASDDEPLLLALSVATLVAATTHDRAAESSPRFDERAVLAMGLAAAVEDAGETWRQWWEYSVRLGEAAEFDLGSVNGNALFWTRFRDAELDLLGPYWLGDTPPPDGSAFERIARALVAAREGAGFTGRIGEPDAAPSDGVRLSPLPVDIRPRLEREVLRRAVWFATNRELVAGDNGDEFTAHPSKTTSFGWCDIEPPSGPKNEPPTSVGEFGFVGIHIADGEEAFLGSLSDHVTDVGEPRRLLLFVHGYNSDFAPSALQAAQLAHDLDIEGEVALFSWPSAGKWYLYGKDAQRVDLGVPVLADLLVRLTRDVGFERIDVIVHSLGNRLFAAAAELAASRAVVPLGSVFLAAADLSFARFEQAAPTIAALTHEPVTAYVSRKDRALLASKLTFNQEARVGRGIPIVIADHVHTIDASDVRAGDFWRHQYFSNTRTLLIDIAAQLRGLIAPDARGSKPVMMRTPENNPYWRFRHS